MKNKVLKRKSYEWKQKPIQEWEIRMWKNELIDNLRDIRQIQILICFLLIILVFWRIK